MAEVQELKLLFKNARYPEECHLKKSVPKNLKALMKLKYENLNSREETVGLDGWSNIHNKLIISSCADLWKILYYRKCK